MNNKFKKILLLFGDIIILYGSLYLTLLIRYSQTPSRELWKMHFFPFSILFAFWILIFYISDLYNLSFATTNRKFYRLSIRSFFIGGLISTIFFYVVPRIIITPKTNLVIFVLIFSCLFLIWRHFFNWSLKSYLPKENLAIIGYNKQVKDLIFELKQKPHLGFHVSFILIPHPENTHKKLIKEKEITVFTNVNDLNILIKQNKISKLILASDPVKSELLSSVLFNCLSLKINYINLSHFYEYITGKVPVEIINKIWFLENLSEGNKKVYDSLKRFFDLFLAFSIFLISLPFWIIFGFIIKIESKGNVLFKQIRVGKNGRTFIMIKFRTMRDNISLKPTEKEDNRITGFGSFMRKTRLDEIPQTLNVIKGDMSFVGPRPEQPKLVTELEKQIPFYRERMLIKPGITGWDQVSGKYHSPSYKDTLEKLQYDLFYIKNRSFYLDLSIILKTISTILSNSGR